MHGDAEGGSPPHLRVEHFSERNTQAAARRPYDHRRLPEHVAGVAELVSSELAGCAGGGRRAVRGRHVTSLVQCIAGRQHTDPAHGHLIEPLDLAMEVQLVELFGGRRRLVAPHGRGLLGGDKHGFAGQAAYLDLPMDPNHVGVVVYRIVVDEKRRAPHAGDCGRRLHLIGCPGRAVVLAHERARLARDELQQRGVVARGGIEDLLVDDQRGVLRQIDYAVVAEDDPQLPVTAGVQLIAELHRLSDRGCTARPAAPDLGSTPRRRNCADILREYRGARQAEYAHEDRQRVSHDQNLTSAPIDPIWRSYWNRDLLELLNVPNHDALTNRWS